jgi:hypothetical protein
MAKFVYIYTGGGMAETPEEQERAMQAWGAWFAGLGERVTDMGNPFGASATVKPGGSSEGAVSRITGYTVIEASSLDEAIGSVANCPVLDTGGSVEVYEAIAM